MDVGNIKSWHCMLVAIVLGLSVGAARQWAGGPTGSANIPADLSGQQLRFENAVVGEVEGHRLVTNIAVTPRWIRGRDGISRLFHIVTADVSSGTAEKTGAGRQLQLRPAVFLMPVPYRPRISLESFRSPSVQNPAGEFSRTAIPTVLDFLRLAQMSRQTRYSYLWWDAHPILFWTGGSVLVIGILLPAGVNLAVFGGLRRPREEKGIRLRKGKVATPSQDVAAEDLSAWDAIDGAESISEPTATHEQESIAPRVAVLIAVPTSGPATSIKTEEPTFGIDEEDYYPTELTGHPPDKGEA